MDQPAHPPRWKTILAFAIIYLVWGSTFLAIRIGVHEIPPFLMAAMRFVAAGSVLVAWTLSRREKLPRAREWGSVCAVAFLIFVIDYGGVFWAEQRVASGITAVIMATISLFMTLFEIVLLGTQRFTARLGVALAVGIAGVAVLVSPSLNVGGSAVDAVGAGVLLCAAVAFALSSALSRRLTLPSSKVMSSGVQMLVGGVMLAVLSASAGEMRGFRFAAVSRGAWMALAYLVVAGSIVAFTAYVWLIHHESPTRVGTYAYVNPVVAVLFGYFLGGEELGVRTVVGSVCVLVSVVAIATMPRPTAN